MNYKRVFKSQKLRRRILNILSFVPDYYMLLIQYYIKLGRIPNLKNPKRYSEKIQYYKLFYRDPLMKTCTDKYDVRDYVISKGLGEYLNTNYGVFSKYEDIDFSNLPDSFVIKDTLGGGGRSVIIVDNKNDANYDEIETQVNSWINTPINRKTAGREWVYSGNKHRIIIEKKLSTNISGDLPDYKFFCFDGKPYCLYVMKNYTKNHADGELSFFSPEFKKIPVRRKDFKEITDPIECPKNFERMLEIAKTLSEGFPHVRVDLYNVDGDIYFGEMTFFNASGYVSFDPDSFDYELGEVFNISF